MKSSTTPDFWEAYEALPRAIKAQAKKTYQIWISDRLTSQTRSKSIHTLSNLPVHN
jgi:hypothetical protein